MKALVSNGFLQEKIISKSCRIILLWTIIGIKVHLYSLKRAILLLSANFSLVTSAWAGLIEFNDFEAEEEDYHGRLS